MTFRLWPRLRSSLWFVPGLIVLAAVTLAVVLVELSLTSGSELPARWPRLFGAGADGSRAMLTAIATSMITVAGVVFSITIVTLSLAASQYSSRVLRHFMDDRGNQAVLGVFVGIFAYCLIVLRTIRGGSEGQFVPALAVLGGVLLAFVGIGFLVYFIHHIATAIQAAHILDAVNAATLRTVDRVMPDPAETEETDRAEGDRRATDGAVVPAPRTGYIQSIDDAALLRLAESEDLAIGLARGIGEFVVEDTALMTVAGVAPLGDEVRERLRETIGIGSQRSIDGDVLYGIRQIVDVALKALSPGINDTTTAVMCLDYLGAILTRITMRRLPPSRRVAGGSVRLVLHMPSYADFVGEAVDQIRRHGETNVTVMARLLATLESLAELPAGAERRRVLVTQAAAVGEAVTRSVAAPGDRGELARRADRLLTRLTAARD